MSYPQVETVAATEVAAAGATVVARVATEVARVATEVAREATEVAREATAEAATVARSKRRGRRHDGLENKCTFD
jgi:hypothetical protein